MTLTHCRYWTSNWTVLIQDHVFQTVSSRHWINGWDASKVRLNGDAPFVISFFWGKSLEINPKTGKVQTKVTATQPAKP
jgi:hypothetical protein